MNKKRIVLLVVLSLLMSVVVTTAADPMTDIGNNPHRQAIEQMAELGVLEGKGNGLFKPADNLTRAEAAKVAMFLAGFDEQDAEQAKALPRAFDDVYAGMEAHEWALGWINLAEREGIIAGYGDGTFGPGDSLTMVQWATILIRILEHETEGLAWPSGYDELAGRLGITEDTAYASSSSIRRDQMAQLSANAVYTVKRPDGSTIIDSWGDRAEEKPGNKPDGGSEQKVESLSISLAFSSQILPEGGGQTTGITVTVTDQAGRPVKDAEVWLVAFAFDDSGPSDREAQLSPTETTTNASGKAVVTYTSLAADDKKIVEIAASAAVGSIAVDGDFHKIMAANQAAVVKGEVRNPYNGAPIKGVHIHFMPEKSDHSIGFTETDSQGRYSIPVPTGSYRMSFERPQMPIRDQINVHASAHGQTYTVNNNKGILKGAITGVSQGKMVMAIGKGYKPGGSDDWTLQATIQSDGSFALALAPDTYELYIVGSSNPSKTGITVQSGRITDIGTVSAH